MTDKNGNKGTDRIKIIIGRTIDGFEGKDG
jgi:hypothetical protein